ncbi:DUF4019 domain-containing protein [Nitrosomonas sp.]|uniref:DUF4019 domain-containing protein n=1 Tax=Nitrosomonas sp. TaxID=42353 RepID=UPI001E19FDAC|nr:DUF4019 domain-containing protein [Nitrosomonas sp.]MCB1948757.1 DUF4019 domain-containing protein [Nitrosomonas sp.]MCP5243533.1 DUF4019 domain-containing protein [Burkholderiales bacterium]MDR4515317.1 DUF4019 domain-containing protein [Nitrosomonas sp.]
MLKQLMVLWILIVCANMASADEQNFLEEIESSARAWLGLNDEGRYAESWRNSSAHFQKKMTEADWLKKANEIRKPLGAMEARYIATAGQAKKLSGLPEGEYVVLQFYTTFKDRTLALETVTLAKEKDVVWRVADYAIK